MHIKEQKTKKNITTRAWTAPCLCRWGVCTPLLSQRAHGEKARPDLLNAKGGGAILGKAAYASNTGPATRNEKLQTIPRLFLVLYDVYSINSKAPLSCFFFTAPTHSPFPSIPRAGKTQRRQSSPRYARAVGVYSNVWCLVLLPIIQCKTPILHFLFLLLLPSQVTCIFLGFFCWSGGGPETLVGRYRVLRWPYGSPTHCTSSS